jgi:putative transposase
MNERAAYPSDLTDEEWTLIESLLPKKKGRGRNPTHSRREMLNALLYLNRSGCAWRMLPHDLPPWSAVYAFWRRLVRRGVLEKINDALRIEIRLEEDREAEPSVVIIDSQSVQTAEKRGRWAMTATSAAKAANGR